jgi:methylated-DNA-protein-cysteine methyltransferase-like protein
VASDFFRDVWDVVRLIPKGRVTSYGAIAKCLGSARSSRMVGWAMNASHSSPEPVPAHRVVNRIGMLSGKAHFPDPDRMAELLEEEGTKVVDDRVVEFKTRFWDPMTELSMD